MKDAGESGAASDALSSAAVWAQSSEDRSGAWRIRLGVPELRGTGANELILIAAVNEAIKRAISASEAIGMMAVNANLFAGRAGEGAAGFCVVASELRRYSDSTAKTMQGWSTLIHALVDVTATSRNQIRRLKMLQEAEGCSPATQAAIAAACERSWMELKATTERNSALVIELQSMIRRAIKLRVTGEVIARSAKIESAYGGAMQRVLQQIAEGIDASIGNLNLYTQDVGRLIHEVNR